MPLSLNAAIRSNGDTTIYVARLLKRDRSSFRLQSAPTDCLAIIIMAEKRLELRQTTVSWLVCSLCESGSGACACCLICVFGRLFIMGTLLPFLVSDCLVPAGTVIKRDAYQRKGTHLPGYLPLTNVAHMVCSPITDRGSEDLFASS